MWFLVGMAGIRVGKAQSFLSPSSRSRDIHQPVLSRAAGLAGAAEGEGPLPAWGAVPDAGGAAGSFQSAAAKGWCELSFFSTTVRVRGSPRTARSMDSLVAS